MAKYEVLQDFTSGQSQFEIPNPLSQIFPNSQIKPVTKSFKKGDVIEASEQADFSLTKKSLVSSDGFIIPADKVKLSSKGFFTAKNMLIGVVAIIIIFGFLKFIKVI